MRRNPQAKNNRRIADELRRQGQHMEIVIEVRPRTTVLGAACLPRPAFPPWANPADISAGLIREENICSEIGALRAPFELSGHPGQGRQIDVIANADEDVGVFRHCLGHRQRAHQRYALHADTIAGRLNKAPHRTQEIGARIADSGAAMRSSLLHSDPVPAKKDCSSNIERSCCSWPCGKSSNLNIWRRFGPEPPARLLLDEDARNTVLKRELNLLPTARVSPPRRQSPRPLSR